MKAGADPEARTFSNGSTPLHMAASKGESEVMTVLIRAGADPNSRRLDGTTPLLQAAGAGHADAMRVLLREKVDPLLEGTDQTGHPFGPLEVAAGSGHTEVVQELIQQLGIEGCGGAGRGAEALEVAASAEITAMLTGAGVVDAGKALVYAARLGRFAITKVLLEQPKRSARRLRAYVDAPCTSRGGTTALMSAICCPSLKIARLLIDAGADTTSAANAELDEGLARGMTPLACTTSLLDEREAAKKRFSMMPLKTTEKELSILRPIRRLLLQVEAVHAVSWLWPSNASSTTSATAAPAAEGSHGTQPTSATRTAMMPILRRRAQRPRVLLAALLSRWAVLDLL